MVAQIFAGAQIEKDMGKYSDHAFVTALLILIGSIPFLIVYFAGGLFGNILGGNFSRTGIPSVGASGALVAIVSLKRFNAGHS